MKNYDDCVEHIVESLCALIKSEGYISLYSNPCNAYTTLLEYECDKEASRLILFALFSEVGRKSKKKETLENEIKALPLNEEALSFLCDVFTSLYSAKRKAELKKKEGAGFDEFISKEWTVRIFLHAKWEDKFGSSINYTFDYDITLSVTDSEIVKKELEKELKKNPFLSAEDILEKYRKGLQDSVNSDFRSYCTADDYYEPDMDEYDGERGDGAIESYLESHGMEFLESEYSYSDDAPW